MTKRTIKKIGLSNSIVTKDCGAQYDNHRISYWFVSAALQEQSRRFSTYAYGLDNPIRFIDPDGMKATDWYLPEGSKVPVFDPEIESQQNLDTKKIAGKYLFETGFMVDADGNTKYYHTDGKVYGAYPQKEASITAKKKSVKGGDKVQSGRVNLINPSGGALRGQDAYGNGHFGASRDGGGRKHMGIDIITIVGQNLVSPVTGKAVNYIGSTSKKPMIDITPSNSALGIDMIRILYVNMPSGVNASNAYNVTAGQTLIGTAADLGTLGYPPKITPHIHVQIMVGGKWVDPTPYFYRR